MSQLYEVIYNVFSSFPFFDVQLIVDNFGLNQSDFSFFVLLVTFGVLFLLFYIPFKCILKLKDKFERIIK